MEPLRPGDPGRIGDHLVEGRLGAAGIGQVFLARTPRGLPVAITLADPHLAGDPAFRSRFRRDVDLARAVRGAYVASVVDADTEAPLPWLAAVFLPGLSLHDAVGVYGPLPAPAVRTLGVGLAEALIAVHRAGTVHGELGPATVRLTTDGLRVTDLGRTGGPSHYLPPERVQREVVEPPGDVFALGACLAYAATGRGPFGEGAAHVVLYRIVHEEPQLDGVADAGLRDVLAACLAKDLADRPSPQEVMDRLAAVEMPDGLAWLPQEMAEGISRYGAAVPPAPARSLPAPAQERVEEPRRWRGLAVGGAAALVLALIASGTHPSLWSDGETCAGIGAAMSIDYDSEPPPVISTSLSSAQEMEKRMAAFDAWLARRKDARDREIKERALRYQALAKEAANPELANALGTIVASGHGWEVVNTYCG
ncbi:serine/threonine protein kinase [Nonomuraea sp. NPDC050556]|uniref:serine/threonine protein kinase n=1 Tax=Nonomuraea sp. NPDC050556 TaxID=3364369 RepID=UPI00379795FD